jgi:hypothetical protein
MTKFVKIPVNSHGEPIRTSREWKSMIANAIAKAPEDRSPAERTAVRREPVGRLKKNAAYMGRQPAFIASSLCAALA